jgi:hypothetical protein
MKTGDAHYGTTAQQIGGARLKEALQKRRG